MPSCDPPIDSSMRREVLGVSGSLRDLALAVPSRPAGDLDDEQMLAKARGSSHWNLTVVDIVWIAPRMLRLTMSAPGIAAMEWLPAQDFTLLIARAGGRGIRRRYTIAGRDNDTIRFDVYLHGEGIGTAWAKTLRPGDTVSGIGPRGKFVLKPHTDWVVLIGDETSLPGIRTMLTATAQPAHVVVEVEDEAEWQHLGVGTRAATKWTWLSRGAWKDESTGVELPEVGTGHAYVSGEAGRVQVWLNELGRLGLDAPAITHKAYWGIGRANATHGEPLV
jgi:NADPH-dependent ferric siderophore reductase